MNEIGDGGTCLFCLNSLNVNNKRQQQ